MSVTCVMRLKLMVFPMEQTVALLKVRIIFSRQGPRTDKSPNPNRTHSTTFFATFMRRLQKRNTGYMARIRSVRADKACHVLVVVPNE